MTNAIQHFSAFFPLKKRFLFPPQFQRASVTHTLPLAFVALFAVANTQAQVLGITAARAGDYVRALTECQASKDTATVDQLFDIGYGGLKTLPAGQDRDRYIDCFESVAMERTGSIPLAFKINADTNRFSRADALLESARQQGKPISGPYFVDFVASRADKPPAERLKEIESLARAGEDWAQEAMAHLHVRRGCAFYNGLCELVTEDRREAIRYLEDATRLERNNSSPRNLGRRLVDLTDLYLDQAAPQYDLNGQACAKARDYANRGAALGDACAVDRRSRMYANGRCEVQDDAAARSWSATEKKLPSVCPIW